MQKPFCDGCGRELQEGIPLVSVRASVTPFTPGHAAEEMAIITENYNRDYHADCWSEREATFLAAVVEPTAYYLAGQSSASETDSAAKVAEPQAESDAPKEEGSGNATAGNLGGDQEPIIPTTPVPAEEQTPEPGATVTEAPPLEEQTAHEQSADSRGVNEPTIPPGVNP